MIGGKILAITEVTTGEVADKESDCKLLLLIITIFVIHFRRSPCTSNSRIEELEL